MSGLVIEVAGRLVADDQCRIMHQGPRDSHALLLAAAEFARQGSAAGAQSNRVEHFSRTRFRVFPSGATDQQRNRDVFRYGERR